MKLHGELTARPILGCQPRPYHHGIIRPEFVHLSTASPLNGATTSAAGVAVGQVLELRMAEQTHSTHARPLTGSLKPPVKRCLVEPLPAATVERGLFGVAEQAQTEQMNCPPAPPAGTTWTGEWNADHGDRIYGTDPVAIGNTAVLLTGIQHHKGATASGVALRIQGTAIPGHPHGAVTTDLTPTQARELAHTLTRLANQAETLDGLGCRDVDD